VNKSSSFTDAHIQLLLEHDSHFQTYWRSRDEMAQEAFLTCIHEIECVSKEEGNLLTEHVRVSHDLARFMVRIQDEPFDYNRLASDWIDFVRDEEAKKKLYDIALRELSSFMQRHVHAQEYILYGGIKQESALVRRMLVPKSEEQFRRSLLDTWDVVRFRLVASDLNVLRGLALLFWEEYFDRIIRCRNYYFRPKDGVHTDPYRAVHFELEIQNGRIIELQMMSQSREIITHLDYAPMFKKTIRFLSAEHEAWLLSLSLKSNLLDRSKCG
jgi:hypothetical protein